MGTLLEKVEVWSDTIPNHINQMEYNLEQLKKVSDPAARVIAGWIENDLNRLKKNAGLTEVKEDLKHAS